jgi:hypothetical protein
MAARFPFSISGEGQNGAQPVASSEVMKPHESLVNGGVCPVLSLPVVTTELERVKGIEPSFRCQPPYINNNQQ